MTAGGSNTFMDRHFEVRFAGVPVSEMKLRLMATAHAVGPVIRQADGRVVGKVRVGSWGLPAGVCAYEAEVLPSDSGSVTTITLNNSSSNSAYRNFARDVLRRGLGRESQEDRKDLHRTVRWKPWILLGLPIILLAGVLTSILSPAVSDSGPCAKLAAVEARLGPYPSETELGDSVAEVSPLVQQCLDGGGTIPHDTPGW